MAWSLFKILCFAYIYTCILIAMHHLMLNWISWLWSLRDLKGTFRYFSIVGYQAMGSCYCCLLHTALSNIIEGMRTWAFMYLTYIPAFWSKNRITFPPRHNVCFPRTWDLSFSVSRYLFSWKVILKSWYLQKSQDLLSWKSDCGFSVSWVS